ncbi:hypothetical protein GW17_00048777 [Ensete ventricosum]|nr:hypothetical protein GW17_00048777 [Ensete ventricosum]
MDYTIERGVERVLGDGFAKAIPGSGGGGVDREGDNPVPRGGRHWRCDFEIDQEVLITQGEGGSDRRLRDCHTETINTDNTLGRPRGTIQRRALPMLVPRALDSGVYVESVDTVSGRHYVMSTMSCQVPTWPGNLEVLGKSTCLR